MMKAPIKRFRRSFAMLIAAIAGWSAQQLLAASIPWTAVAAFLAITLGVATVHAATIALYMRLITSIGSAVRLSPLGRRLLGATTLAAIGLCYWFAAAADGPGRQLGVTALFLLGLAFYASRHEIGHALRVRFVHVERSS